VLTARGVRKRYARRGPWVLDRIDLVATPGTTTLIHGGNGSGKSTLLRIAAGVIDPTAGTVDRPAGSTAYVPERAPSLIRMSASQYVGHMGRIRGLDARRCASRAAELFARLALAPGPDVPVPELSKGNRQKVMLAQAFLEPVALLAFDEPFAGLDRDAHTTLLDLLDDARAGGTAVIVTGHSAVGVPADRVLRIADGSLYEERRDAAGPAARALRGRPEPDVGTRVELTRGAQRAVVVVEPGASDDLLRRALASGWSVARVDRTELG
jgi:ABC-2 type transport system ATP-binding protein